MNETKPAADPDLFYEKIDGHWYLKSRRINNAIDSSGTAADFENKFALGWIGVLMIAMFFAAIAGVIKLAIMLIS